MKKTVTFTSAFRSALLMKKQGFTLRSNKIIRFIVKLLLKAGRIKSAKFSYGYITIELFYDNLGQSIIKELEIISTPSKLVNRKYTQLLDVFKTKPANKLYILSTVEGIQTLEDCIVMKMGGIVLFSLT